MILAKVELVRVILGVKRDLFRKQGPAGYPKAFLISLVLTCRTYMFQFALGKTNVAGGTGMGYT